MLWEPEDVVRALDPSEQRFVRHATFTGRSVTVLGELDAAGLGAAFAALQRRFPILVCRIVED
ncbi:acyltransferase, partial [Nocardia sp. NPDC060220]